MDMLQLREKEIFETLKKISNAHFVVIGGYAVNAYTLPRFSVDCDIVVGDRKELEKIEKVLGKIGYVKLEINKDSLPYHSSFLRYEKDLGNNFKASIDILISNVIDRQTNAKFSAEWAFENSEERALKGKTIIEEFKIRIINIDALIAMKFVSCRVPDIRDVFMLIPNAKNIRGIKEEISKRYNFENRFKKIKDKILSKKFRDDLQGVHGYIEDEIFEKHKNALLEMENV